MEQLKCGIAAIWKNHNDIILYLIYECFVYTVFLKI